MTAATAFLRERGGWVLLGLIVVVAALTGYIVWTLRDLPDPGKQDVLAHSIVVYDRNDKVIEERDAKGQFHQVLTLDRMGKSAPAATLAAEDR